MEGDLHRKLWGETSAFLALFLDNVGTLIIMSGVLVGTFGFPVETVLNRMIPGTALGICAGDLIYTWLAVRLGKKTGRRDVTAMPLGVDTPSTIGIAYTVIGPAYMASRNAELAWQIGVVTLFMIGCVKVIFSFFGGILQRSVPTAGLLGPLAGIGLTLLAFLPLLDVFNEPLTGMTALALIFMALTTKFRLPGRFPGLLAAFVGSTAIHFLLGYGGFLRDFTVPSPECSFSPPLFTLAFLGKLPDNLHLLTLALPFSVMTIIGGINNTESARLAGDPYRTRDILFTEALTSLVAAFFGGVAQTTPYIGHPAYKKMGAGWFYTLLTAIAIGVGAVVGLFSLIVKFIPKAVFAPIFIFIGFEMMRQAFENVPSSHLPALNLSMMPAVASLIAVILEQFLGAAGIRPEDLPPHLTMLHQTVVMLSNGFILTGLLWGSILTFLIDGKRNRAALWSACAALMTTCGVIHSVRPGGDLYLPWHVNTSAPYMLSAGYLALTAIISIMRKGADNSG